MSDQAPNKEKAPQRNNPALAVDDANPENEQMSTEDEHSSPSSLQNTGSEYGESSAPVSANTTGDITYDARLPNEPRTEPDGKDSVPPTSFQVKGQFFFGGEPELQSSREPKEHQSNSSLTGSTTELCLPPSPSVNERRPPESLAVPPMNLNIPTISVLLDKSIEEPSSVETSTKTKAKGTLGIAFNKLVVRLSPRKEKLSPSDTSAIPGSSISTEASPGSSSDKQKAKKSSPLRFLLGQKKSPKDSPDKKKSPSKFKSLVENALHPKKLFPPRCSDEASGHLCDFEDPLKTKDEKTKSAKPYWEDVVIPKDFKKVESINFSDTTVDSLSTQWSFTTLSPQSDTLNPNQEDGTDRASEIPPIPESSKTESDEDKKSEKE